MKLKNLILFILVSGLAFWSCELEPVIEEVEVKPSTVSIKVGETQQFTASVIDENGDTTDVDVEWSSSDEAIATIDQTGLATGIAVGATTITATADDVSGTATLAVGMAVDELLLGKWDREDFDMSLEITTNSDQELVDLKHAGSGSGLALSGNAEGLLNYINPMFLFKPPGECFDETTDEWIDIPDSVECENAGYNWRTYDPDMGPIFAAQNLSLAEFIDDPEALIGQTVQFFELFRDHEKHGPQDRDTIITRAVVVEWVIEDPYEPWFKDEGPPDSLYLNEDPQYTLDPLTNQLTLDNLTLYRAYFEQREDEHGHHDSLTGWDSTKTVTLNGNLAPVYNTIAANTPTNIMFPFFKDEMEDGGPPNWLEFFEDGTVMGEETWLECEHINGTEVCSTVTETFEDEWFTEGDSLIIVEEWDEGGVTYNDTILLDYNLESDGRMRLFHREDWCEMDEFDEQEGWTTEGCLREHEWMFGFDEGSLESVIMEMEIFYRKAGTTRLLASWSSPWERSRRVQRILRSSHRLGYSLRP